MEIKEITKEQLIKKIKQVQKEKFICLTTRKKQKMLKKSRETKQPNPYEDKLFKITKYEGITIAGNYQDKVNRQRISEGKQANFIPQSLPFGQWLKLDENRNSITIIEHKEKFYLRIYILKESNTTSFYMSNEKIVQYEELAQYLSKPSKNKSQNLNQPVKVQTISIDNIDSIVLNGIKHIIKDK